MENVLYVPNLRKNVFSVGVCTAKGYSTVFENQAVKILYNNALIGQGVKQNNETYQMLFEVIVNREANTATNEDLQLWHKRARHVNVRKLQTMVQKKLINGVSVGERVNILCEACQLAMSHVLPFAPKTEHRD